MRSSVTKALKIVLVRDLQSSNDSSGIRFLTTSDGEPSAVASIFEIDFLL
jgi:hypothetical protein